MEWKYRDLRHEHKYFINQGEYMLLRNRLHHALKGDSFADENNEYRIRSLYFDDVYNKGSFEKQSGTDTREKYRIRIYNLNTDTIKLEKKSKYGQLTSKETALIDREGAEKIIKGDIDFLLGSDNSLFRGFYIKHRNNILRPVVIVDYVREAYVYPLERVRITFDKYLRTGLSSIDLFDKDLLVISALDEPVMIMEIKYNSFLPGNIRALLQLPVRQRMSISKYDICRKFVKTNNWEDN